MVSFRFFTSPWLKQFWHDLGTTPKYLQLQGYRKGVVRLFKALILHGLAGFTNELDRVRHAVRYVSGEDLDFIIYAPDFLPNSAGRYCLYKICHDLNAKGFKAAVTESLVSCPNLNAPLLTLRDAKQVARRKKPWVIYPETISGNPLGAERVIRWVLNRPGLLGGDTVYADNELVFVYSNIYAPFVKNKIQGVLYLPTLDEEIFYPPKNAQQERGLACYYVGKSSFKEGHFDRATTFEITRDVPTKKELGNIFRSAKILYCFDNATAVAHEAIACGCPVLVIPDGTQTWENYAQSELGTHGIMWGQLDPDVKIDQRLVEAKVSALKANYSAQLEKLLELTQRSGRPKAEPVSRPIKAEISL